VLKRPEDEEGREGRNGAGEGERTGVGEDEISPLSVSVSVSALLDDSSSSERIETKLEMTPNFPGVLG
jgi:hypothetical protein